MSQLNELKKELEELKSKVDQGFDRLDILKKEETLAEYEKEMALPEFWSDSAIAQEVTKKHAKLEKQLKPWIELAKNLQDMAEMIELDDNSMNDELENQLSGYTKTYNDLEFELNFSGTYDSHDALVSMQSGAGGTDAQDWAQMLQRMYVRWAEDNDYKVELLEESVGEEAGIKSATLTISGPYAYGKLRGEHGVHRLVRLSPFNSAASRETSFAMVEVVPQIDEPDEVEIDEKDLRVDSFRASGHGGQSVNTTDSAVRVTHTPTNIVVSIQNEKSQIQNRETAMKILRSKLAQLAAEQHEEKISKLKGPNKEAAWGNQIRNYVMHPYTQVKDTRTNHAESDTKAVLDGKLNPFIESFLSSGEL